MLVSQPLSTRTSSTPQTLGHLPVRFGRPPAPQVLSIHPVSPLLRHQPQFSCNKTYWSAPKSQSTTPCLKLHHRLPTTTLQTSATYAPSHRRPTFLSLQISHSPPTFIHPPRSQPTILRKFSPTTGFRQAPLQISHHVQG